MQVPVAALPSPGPHGQVSMLLACRACAPGPCSPGCPCPEPPAPCSNHKEPFPEQGGSSTWHCQWGQSPPDLLHGAELRADRWSHMGKLIIFFSFFPGHL